MRNIEPGSICSGARTKAVRLMLFGAALAIAVAGAPEMAAAQSNWPERPVTLILPYPPGGTVDTQARIMGERLSKRLGQPFVVQSRPGATGAIATEFVTRAKPDGYTLLFGSSAQTTSVPMTDKVSYKVEDLIPVSASGLGPMVLAINAALPARTLPEFIELMRASPGKYNYASAGTGSVAHLVGALFVSEAKIDLQHVPYRGGALAVTDLMGGQVVMYFGNSADLLQHRGNERIRIIGVSTPERMKQLPDVPAVNEALPGFELTAWQGFLAPKGTPQAIVDKLATEVQSIAKEPDVIERLGAVGVQGISTNPAEFVKMIEREQSIYAAAVKAAGLKRP